MHGSDRTGEARSGSWNPPHTLRELLEAAGAGSTAPNIAIREIRTRSTEVQKGDLFIALSGSRLDGHAFIDEAIERGAVGVVTEQDTGRTHDIPVVRVHSTRELLADLAAAWHGRPANGMQIVGITGTVGKTSVLTILHRIMTTANLPIGTMGSLGVYFQGHPVGETGFTAPDPLILHSKLAELRAAGCNLLAMEVTSHALAQKRIHGLTFDLGVLTNLLPLEHQDYHGTFEEYVEAKLRFFEHLRSDATVIYNADDRAVCEIVREQPIRAVGVGRTNEADVIIDEFTMSAAGSELTLLVDGGLPTLDGAMIRDLRLPLKLGLLGRSNIYNAALATTIALTLGARPNDVRTALSSLPAASRRVEVIHRGEFMIIDDTAGHPDSVNAIFEVVEALAPRKLHIAFAVRGNRGPVINREVADTLAIWSRNHPPESLFVTRAKETTDGRNLVSDEEYSAFVESLRESGVNFVESEQLDQAVFSVLNQAEAGDLVLLLGAQGMDAGAEIARGWLSARASA